MLSHVMLQLDLIYIGLLYGSFQQNDALYSSHFPPRKRNMSPDCMPFVR